MFQPRDAPSWFCKPLETAEALADEIGVVVVANILGRTTPSEDYEEDSIVTEFLVNEELDHIVSGFQKAGFYCETVVDEQGFLRWLETYTKSFPRRLPLVYNLAQNGTGSARLSLVPALCRLHRLPLLDSSGYAVTIARHKFHAAMLLDRLGLPMARSWWFTNDGWVPSRPPDGLRLIAKPTFESASIGIHPDSVFLMGPEADAVLGRKSAAYRQPLIVQEFVAGFEVEVPVFDSGKACTLAAVGLAVGETRELGDRFLTYADVAKDGYSFYDFTEVNAAAAIKAMSAARAAFSALGFNGAGRVDFRVRPDGEIAIIEVACKPHLTEHSSFAFALRGIGRTPPDLFKFLVGSAAIRHALKP